MRRIIIFCTILVFLAVQFASATSHIEQMNRELQMAMEATEPMLEEAIQFMEAQLANVGYEEQKVDEIIKYINYYIRSVSLSETNEITPDITIYLPWWVVVLMILYIGILATFIYIYSVIVCGGRLCTQLETGDQISEACYEWCCGQDDNTHLPVCR